MTSESPGMLFLGMVAQLGPWFAAALVVPQLGAWAVRLMTGRSNGRTAITRMADWLGFDTITDAMLPDGEGGLLRLDHVIRLRDRLLVISCQSANGWLFGRAGDEVWTQRFPGVCLSLPNPLPDNDDRVRAVRAQLPGAAVEGLVVLLGDGGFPKGLPRGVMDLSTLGSLLADGRANADLPADARLAQAWEQLRSLTERHSARTLPRRQDFPQRGLAALRVMFVIGCTGMMVGMLA